MDRGGQWRCLVSTTDVMPAGKYSTADQTPEGIKLTAHVDTASNQAITGNDRVYFMRVDGNKLMMKSQAVIVPTTGEKSVVELKLVKAD